MRTRTNRVRPCLRASLARAVFARARGSLPLRAHAHTRARVPLATRAPRADRAVCPGSSRRSRSRRCRARSRRRWLRPTKCRWPQRRRLPTREAQYHRLRPGRLRQPCGCWRGGARQRGGSPARCRKCAQVGHRPCASFSSCGRDALEMARACALALARTARVPISSAHVSSSSSSLPSAANAEASAGPSAGAAVLANDAVASSSGAHPSFAPGACAVSAADTRARRETGGYDTTRRAPPPCAPRTPRRRRDRTARGG